MAVLGKYTQILFAPVFLTHFNVFRLQKLIFVKNIDVSSVEWQVGIGCLMAHKH